MPSMTERAFWKALQTRYPPAIYLHGEDEYLKEQALRQLLRNAVDSATRDFNLDVRAGSDLDAETLGSLVGTPPLMADRRVVVIRDVGSLRKDARGALERYLEQPAEDVLLILLGAGGDRAKGDKTLESRAASLAFDVLSGERVPRWISHTASSELGVTITPEAVDLLLQSVGSDLPTLATELEKLASYSRGETIDERAVSDVVGVRRGETLADLLDAVARKDATRALDLMPHVLEQPKTTAVSIVMALTVQMLAIGWGLDKQGRGERVDFVELLRIAPNSITGRGWGDAGRAWADALDRWDAPAIDAALESLLAADIALKETRLSSDEQLLASLMLSLCLGASPRSSIAA
jgi:DNA polymerase III subunit delta